MGKMKLFVCNDKGWRRGLLLCRVHRTLGFCTHRFYRTTTHIFLAASLPKRNS